jgi:hypothetical protein
VILNQFELNVSDQDVLRKNSLKLATIKIYKYIIELMLNEVQLQTKI